MDINKDNYELFLFQYQEGLLSPQEREEVEHYLRQHPEAEEMMRLYDPELRLHDEEPLLFPDKQQLKRRSVALAPRAMTPRWVAVAASVAVLLGIGLFFTYHGTAPTEEPIVVAQNRMEPVNPVAPDVPSASLPSVARPAHHTVQQTANQPTPHIDEQAPDDILVMTEETKHEETFAVVESYPLRETALAMAEPDESTIVTDRLVRYTDDTLEFTTFTDRLVTISDEYPSPLPSKWMLDLQRRWNRSEEAQLIAYRREQVANRWNAITLTLRKFTINNQNS